VALPHSFTRAFAAGALSLTLALTACGGEREPWVQKSEQAQQAAPQPAEGGGPPLTDAGPTSPAPDGTPAPAPATTPPENEAPIQAGTTPPDAPAADAVRQDQEAMLSVRQMVSLIEGCRSGRAGYDDCDTHDELGTPEVIGVTIGDQVGEVQVFASPKAFRITARSESGAKFTMARGPKGDRFRCIPVPAGGGACPSDRTWAF
jgi:hypothetical protein